MDHQEQFPTADLRESRDSNRGTGAASQEEIILRAAEAKTAGHGMNAFMEKKDTFYDTVVRAVTCIGMDSTITYAVPAGVCGKFDIYLNVSKTIYAYGTTPVSLCVNGRREPVLPIALAASAPDGSDLYAMGKFLLAGSIDLKAGDALTVCGKDGFTIDYNDMQASVMPAVGDLFLYPAGTPVAIGYDHILPKEQAVDGADPLSGRKFLWLGSSVTYGDASGGYAMAEEIEKKHAAAKCYKYAICGTTLANDRASSYVQRMKEIDPKMDVDILIVQLSTNDAGQGKPLGSICAGRDPADFDDTTVLGAIETIISYARSTWHCPIAFYTGTYFESEDSAQGEQYAAMVEQLLELQKKWDIDVIDLWNDKEMTALYGSELYDTYMRDPVHPKKEGYVSWWTPKFESCLIEILDRRDAKRR